MISNFYKIFFSFLLLTLTAPLVYVLASYNFDPIHLFNPGKQVIVPLVKGDDRLKASLIIRTQNYDSVILGSSMLKRFNENSVSQKNNRFVNLSTRGSTIHERIKYLEYIYQNKKNIKDVVFSLDHGLSLHHRNFPINMNPNDWMYLFDNNNLNDLKLYFQYEYAACIFTHFIDNCNLRKTNVQRTENYFKIRYEQDKKISGIEGWLSEKGRWKMIAKRVERIEKKGTFVKKFTTDFKNDLNQLKQLALDNQSTNFHLIIPPYSIMYLKLMKQHHPNLYLDYRMFLNYVHTNYQNIPNIKIIIFDGSNMTKDYSHYIDMRHYIGPIMKSVQDSIGLQSFFLSKDFDEQFSDIDYAVENFNLPNFEAL